jgi:hypothetical protein
MKAKMSGGLAQAIECLPPEFKPQNHPTKTKTKKAYVSKLIVFYNFYILLNVFLTLRS